MTYPTLKDTRECHRKSCTAPASPDCVHRQTGDTYCPGCAKRINHHNPGLVVSHRKLEIVALAASGLSLMEVRRFADRKAEESIGAMAIPPELLKGDKNDL